LLELVAYECGIKISRRRGRASEGRLHGLMTREAYIISISGEMNLASFAKLSNSLSSLKHIMFDISGLEGAPCGSPSAQHEIRPIEKEISWLMPRELRSPTIRRSVIVGKKSSKSRLRRNLLRR